MQELRYTVSQNLGMLVERKTCYIDSDAGLCNFEFSFVWVLMQRHV
jgi:hypothetical protein